VSLPRKREEGGGRKEKGERCAEQRKNRKKNLKKYKCNGRERQGV
jgi:hypothetical protein